MSNEPDLTAILDDLAAGRIDAAEASRRIAAARTEATRAVAVEDAAAEDTPAPASEPTWRAYAREDVRPPTSPVPAPAPAPEAAPSPAPEPAPAPAPEPAEPREAPRGPNPAGAGGQRLSVRSVGRRVRVVGDRTVAGVSVSGPHVLRRSGQTVEVTGEGQPNPLQNLNLLRLPRSLDDLKSVGLGAELVIRVNPSLVVDAEVTASGLAVEGVPTLGRIRVTAGAASLKGVRHVSDLLVQMGGATVEGPIAEGRSKVKCESGTLTVVLSEGANVTVRGQANMGRVVWPGDEAGTVDEWVVGNGAGRLDVEIVMGVATIRDAAVADAPPETRGAEAAHCQSCGEPVAGGRFCPACGAPQPAGACLSCGRALPTGARFCPDCGAPA